MHWIDINDRSAVAATRRMARKYASELNFSSSRVEELAIVVSEATTNILRYADRGRVLFDVKQEPGNETINTVFTDGGPGISDLDRMMADGVSSSASGGLGLGAIRRLSDSFDIYSSAEYGTTIVSTFHCADTPTNSAPVDAAGLRVCHPSEKTCGDNFFIRQTAERVDIFLCDGLGHGEKAAEAAEEIIDAVKSNAASPADTIANLSRNMVGHRGAVAAMVRLELPELKLTYSGLGNISTIRLGRSGSKRLAVRDGRIGGAPTHGFEEEMTLQAGDMIIMHSDGLKVTGSDKLLPGLRSRRPLLAGSVLLDRQFRGRDDASIVAARIRDDHQA